MKQILKLAKKFQAAGQDREASIVNKLVKSKSITLCLIHNEDQNVKKKLEELGLVGTLLNSPGIDVLGLYISYQI